MITSTLALAVFFTAIFVEVCTNEPFSRTEESEKVYLNPDAIFPTVNGLFAKTEDGDCIRIPFVISSERGLYTVFSKTDSTVYPVIKCRNCDLPFSPTIFNRGKCPSCGAQN